MWMQSVINPSIYLKFFSCAGQTQQTTKKAYYVAPCESSLFVRYDDSFFDLQELVPQIEIPYFVFLIGGVNV